MLDVNFRLELSLFGGVFPQINFLLNQPIFVAKTDKSSHQYLFRIKRVVSLLHFKFQQPNLHDTNEYF